MIRPYKLDLQGQRFGKLTVLKEVSERRCGHVVWECLCDCGKTCIVRGGHLKSGHSTSCGCFSSEKTIEMNTTHGGTHSRLYSIWASMKSRCNNPQNKAYSYYGGRGIRVCEEWEKDFSAFRDWAESHGYSPELTLDRINPDGNYEPNNCKWATWHEQRINQRRRRYGTV